MNGVVAVSLGAQGAWDPWSGGGEEEYYEEEEEQGAPIDNLCERDGQLCASGSIGGGVLHVWQAWAFCPRWHLREQGREERRQKGRGRKEVSVSPAPRVWVLHMRRRPLPI